MHGGGRFSSSPVLHFFFGTLLSSSSPNGGCSVFLNQISLFFLLCIFVCILRCFSLFLLNLFSASSPNPDGVLISTRTFSDSSRSVGLDLSISTVHGCLTTQLEFIYCNQKTLTICRRKAKQSPRIIIFPFRVQSHSGRLLPRHWRSKELDG